MLFEYFNEFLGDIVGSKNAVIVLIGLLLVIYGIVLGYATFAKASGFPMPTENSNIYKKWSRDFGIDNYDEFKKWNKSNNSYRGRSSYRRRRGGW
jgi:hypothetical protein